MSINIELTSKDGVVLQTKGKLCEENIVIVPDESILGSEPELQDKTVSPTTSQQTVTADEGYDGLSSVGVSAVTSSIDSNIKAANIKSGVTILGVTGTLEGETGTGYTVKLGAASHEYTQNSSFNSYRSISLTYRIDTDDPDDCRSTGTISNGYVTLKNVRYFKLVDTYAPSDLNEQYFLTWNCNFTDEELRKGQTLTQDIEIEWYGACLTGDTLVTMADYSTKRLDEIELGEEILSYDWNTMQLVPNKVIFTDKDMNKSHIEYDVWTFDDGSIVKTVHRHRFFNVEHKAFVYMDEWNIGEHTMKIDGSMPMLVSHETIKETVNHYKITGELGTNYFANGLLTGDRYCPTNIELPEVNNV